MGFRCKIGGDSVFSCGLHQELEEMSETMELMTLILWDDDVACESMHSPLTIESGVEYVIGLTPKMMTLEPVR